MNRDALVNGRDLSIEIGEPIEKSIERLLCYGFLRKLFSPYDLNDTRNKLIEILNIQDYKPEHAAAMLVFYDNENALTQMPQIDAILKPLLDYASENDLLLVDTAGGRDLMDARIMGALMPRPSQVIEQFQKAYALSPELATQQYYQMSLHSNYIRKERTDKNIVWQVDSEFGLMDITINLSKPEKDPKEIEAEKYAVKANYPKCLLCAENEGYMGRLNHPARQNHRILPLKLNGEDWYFQYSPYAYYNEHAIVLSKEHRPMKIEKETFVRLLDFVHYMPHYFVGSNADLPIVGGSILSHDHFQGGRYTFPMETAKTVKRYNKGEIHIDFIKWPLSVLRLSGKDRATLAREAAEILAAWRCYSDSEFSIVSHTEKVPHNTITPVARQKNGVYELDLVLRNNRTSEQYPDGIFHTHPEIHGVKKENIGLIEVMGLAVLPARLKEEMAIIEKMLSGETCSEEELAQVIKHESMINTLKMKTNELSNVKKEAIIKHEIGQYFVTGLTHCGVYPPNDHGAVGVDRFLEPLGWR